MVARPTALPQGSEACRRLLREFLDDPSTSSAEALGSFSPEMVEAALKTLLPRGGELLPIVSALEKSREKAFKKVARRMRYRLRRAGVAVPERSLPSPSPKPMWTLKEAWASPVDGTGSRAFWLTAEGAYGEWLRLTLVLNDQVGILDAVGGPIAKKRIAAELQHLNRHEHSRWIPLPPDYTPGLISEALALHTSEVPHREFLRWQALLEGPPISRPLILEHLDPDQIRADPTLLDHSGEILTEPELADWFFDPDGVQSAALELEEARASRLVLSDTQKAEREATIMARTADERFTEAERTRWRRRLEETAYLFWRTGRQHEARLALAAALALGDTARAPRHQPFCLAVVRRSLEVAAEVQAGRLNADVASRRPRRPATGGTAT